MKTMARFWNFSNNQENENEVELRITGEILDDGDSWIYDWFGIPHASPNAFRTELSKHKGKNITIWIDSYGGDVFAGAGMYNALMEHKQSGAKVTVKVDGKAMSAASVIAMAGDEILISPVGMMMIHNPMSYLSGGWGEAKDFRHAADVLDEVKETIMNAYQAKTGKSRNKISELMDNETYMSAKTAIKQGFADKILYSDANESTPVENNFMLSRLAIINSMDDTKKKLIEFIQSAPQATAAEQTPVANIANSNSKGEKKIMNLEELRAAYPDLVAQIENNAKQEGAKEERQRIQNIEEISKNIDPALVNKAKFEEPMNAEKLAFEAMKLNAQKGQEYLQNVATETQNSGVQAVAAAANNAVSTGEQKPKKIENVISEVGAKFERARKGEK
jgi:ATP-dependent protease ClpP protease subunit